MEFLVLGCGYTGRRVARRLLDDGARVVATSRAPESLDLPGAKVCRWRLGDPLPVSAGARVLYSVPETDPATLAGLERVAARVVYLSSTGVYGETPEVDDATPAAPVTERQRARIAAEDGIRALGCSTLVLRPAAIYGPGRGVHVLMRQRRYRLRGDGANFTSRIHVDDLAALCVAALRADLEGAYPVADDGPARAREVAEFCARLLDLPLPPSGDVHETLRFTRKVDGREVRRLLKVDLAYPDYESGIPAALREE